MVCLMCLLDESYVCVWCPCPLRVKVDTHVLRLNSVSNVVRRFMGMSVQVVSVFSQLVCNMKFGEIPEGQALSFCKSGWIVCRPSWLDVRTYHSCSSA